MRARVLIIEGRFYDEISDELVAGAVAALEAQGVAYDRITVPGALEIPQVLAQAVAAGLIPRRADNGKWDGAIALGCVIRGETSHYDIVCNNANHWLMEVAIKHAVPVGNGILTVDTEAAGAGAGARRRRRQGRRRGARLSAADRAAARVRGAERMTTTSKATPTPGKIALPPRTAARVATVQGLYQMDLAGTDLNDVIDEFMRCAFRARRAMRRPPAPIRRSSPSCCAASCAASATSIRSSTTSSPKAGAWCASTPSCAPSCAPACSS